MSLKDFILSNKSYALGIEVSDCDDAIKKGTELLIKAGAAEPRYTQAVIDIKNENGPYYVLAPGIAMPHARPESGALATGFSLMTLAKPVAFGHETNDPVDIVLCISAKDKDDLNNNVIIDVMTLLENDEIIADLRRAKTEDDLRKIFDEVEELNS